MPGVMKFRPPGSIMARLPGQNALLNPWIENFSKEVEERLFRKTRELKNDREK